MYNQIKRTHTLYFFPLKSSRRLSKQLIHDEGRIDGSGGSRLPHGQHLGRVGQRAKRAAGWLSGLRPGEALALDDAVAL